MQIAQSSPIESSFNHSYSSAFQLTKQIEGDFLEVHHEQLNLSMSEHFLKLAKLVNIDQLSKDTADQSGVLLFGRYDIALLLVKENLKRNLDSPLNNEDKDLYIEAIFSKLYRMHASEIIKADYQRRFKIFCDLESVYPIVSLDTSFLNLSQYCKKIIEARDLSAGKGDYDSSFIDAFHNIFIMSPPFLYDSSLSLVAQSHTDFVNYLRARQERHETR